jgi:hypothetical protein
MAQGFLPVVFLANYATYGPMVQNDLILTDPSYLTAANARKALNLLSGESGWNPCTSRGITIQMSSVLFVRAESACSFDHRSRSER